MSGLPDRPQWVPVAQMVPEGSIGSLLISQTQDLGVRLRSETTLQQPLKHDTFLVRRLGFKTHGEVLNLSVNQFDELKAGRSSILYRIEDYVHNLMILPHTRLVAATYLTHENLVKAEYEPEIKEKVEEALDKLEDSRQGEVLTLHFGLFDGIARGYTDISGRVGIPDYMVKSDLGRGLEAMKHSRAGLREVQVLSEDSLGYRVFGAHLRGELPELDGFSFNSINELRLSDRAREQLGQHYHLPWRIYDLVMLNSKYIPEWLMEEVVPALNQRAEEVAERFKKAEEIRARYKADEELTEKERKLMVAEKMKAGKCVLFPGLELRPEALDTLFDVSIYDLNLSARPSNSLLRRQVKTVGDLLFHSEHDLLGGNLGVKSLSEIKEKALLFIIKLVREEPKT